MYGFLTTITEATTTTVRKVRMLESLFVFGGKLNLWSNLRYTYGFVGFVVDRWIAHDILRQLEVFGIDKLDQRRVSPARITNRAIPLLRMH